LPAPKIPVLRAPRRVKTPRLTKKPGSVIVLGVSRARVAKWQTQWTQKAIQDIFNTSNFQLKAVF
jgi:hypothetical protein